VYCIMAGASVREMALKNLLRAPPHRAASPSCVRATGERLAAIRDSISTQRASGGTYS
jgi:hypothetical protein